MYSGVGQNRPALMLLHPTGMAHIEGNTQAGLLGWKTVLGSENVAVRGRSNQEDARDKNLLFARLEGARTVIGLTVAQEVKRSSE
jgi:hypothetical protein